jgi:hypothetical protein
LKGLLGIKRMKGMAPWAALWVRTYGEVQAGNVGNAYVMLMTVLV